MRNLPLTLKQWRVIGAGVVVIGAFLITLPLLLQLLFGLGRLLFLIIIIVVISIGVTMVIRQLPRIQKILEAPDKMLKSKNDSDDHQ